MVDSLQLPALIIAVLAVVLAFGPTFAYALFASITRGHPRSAPALIES